MIFIEIPAFIWKGIHSINGVPEERIWIVRLKEIIIRKEVLQLPFFSFMNLAVSQISL